MSTLRRQLAALTISPTLLVVLTACGGDDREGRPDSASSDNTASTVSTSDAPTPTTESESPVVLLGEDSEAMADVLQAAVPALKGRVQMTEDNDTNELFGRPGQYDQVTFLGDTRLGCTAGDDYNDLDTACGVKIERWPSADAAQARAKDIQRKLRDYGLGAEWDYVVGRLVVRASGDYKPSQVAAIQEASIAGEPIAPS